jgi:hypothetical protein
MKMNQKEFRKRIKEEYSKTEEEDEAMSLSIELGLKGQIKLLEKKKRIGKARLQYPEVSRRKMIQLLGAYTEIICPECHKQEISYNDSELQFHNPTQYSGKIPVVALKSMKNAVSQGIFDRINVVTGRIRERRQRDPLLVGTIGRRFFLISKWV